MFFALGLILTQAPPITVTVELDRQRVAVGEELVYTLKAIGHSTASFRVDLPALEGLAVVDRRERTDVAVGTREATRAYTLELRLRAEQVGTWSIGPIRVEHADASAFSPVAVVQVVNASGGAAPGLEPDLLALISRVPSPRAETPSVFVVTSGEVVYAGDQVNVLTAAWLPRGLRLRLRQSPTLTPPALPGVWSTPRASVPGAVASRIVDGETYDLYVGFQTVYPLNPGSVPVPPARLSWLQPSGRQYFSEERRLSAESRVTMLVVRPVPALGRPPGFDGPVARDITITYRLGSGSARAGTVLPVELVVSGAGNLPLWPTPSIQWPAGARVYEEGTENGPRMIGVRLGGTKTIRLAVVPDSAGSLSLPPLEYPYFDPGDGTYKIARAPGIVVPVLDALPTADRRTPPALEQPAPPTIVERVMALPAVVLLLLALGPVLLVGFTLWGRRRPQYRAAATPIADPAERLDALVSAVLRPDGAASPRALGGALRAAGIERVSAERLVALHASLEAERFGPDGAGRATPALSREIDAALESLPRRVRQRAGLHAVLVGGLLIVPVASATQRAQSASELYQRGEFVAAAQAFRGTAGREGVQSPEIWYNVAAAEYMARRDAHAVAALLAVRGKAPRDPRAQALWAALAREHELLRRAGTRWPVTAEECFLAALGLAWLGVLLIAVRKRSTIAWGLPLVLAVATGSTGLLLLLQRQVPRAVLAGGVSLRVSPHGLSPERGAAPGFSIVRLDRRLGSWWLVSTIDGNAGWVPADILAFTPSLD
jgi:hypothetical protein